VKNSSSEIGDFDLSLAYPVYVDIQDWYLDNIFTPLNQELQSFIGYAITSALSARISDMLHKLFSNLESQKIIHSWRIFQSSSNAQAIQLDQFTIKVNTFPSNMFATKLLNGQSLLTVVKIDISGITIEPPVFFGEQFLEDRSVEDYIIKKGW